MLSSQIVVLNRMRHEPYVFVPRTPVLSVHRTVVSGVEGSSIVFEVRRTEVLTGRCTCTWTAVSAGGAGDLTGATTGTAVLESNAAEPYRITIRTVNRSGTQGTRELTVTLSNPQGGLIDPTRISASSMIEDRSAAASWWTGITGRSARANGRLSGTSYWAAATSAIDAEFGKYQREVAYIDAYNGGRPTGQGQSTATMALTHGGPTDTTNSTITPGSQLDWTASRDHFTTGWRYLPAGTWCIWAMNMIGWDRRTDGGNHSIWQEIIDGDWDRSFANMGRRVKANIDSQASNPKGHPANRLIFRLNHENNQSNYYSVVEASKLKYKQAMERALERIRDGLGNYGPDVKFAHAPAHGGYQLGDYLSWCPSNVDALSVSWHPGKTITTQARLDAYMAGTDTSSAYGPAELLQASIDTGLPMVFPEWSPRFEWGSTEARQYACPIANTALIAFDEFLTDNAARIVCDCVYHVATLNPNAYEAPDAAGAQQWRDSVTTYKTRWSGTKAPS